MNKKLIFLLQIILVILCLFSIALFTMMSMRKKELEKPSEGKLIEKLSFYEDRETRYRRMAKTLKLSYNLSDYESRYYSIIFDDFSQQYKIPWEIYPALIRVESNFRTTLKSSKSAKGITQVLEGTAKEICESLDIRYIPEETLWNDLLNIIIGLTYLSRNISRNIATDTLIDSSAIRHGIQCYLGGPDYLRSIKNNQQTSEYLTQYKTTVWFEYTKLKYIYYGVIKEEEDLQK